MVWFPVQNIRKIIFKWKEKNERKKQRLKLKIRIIDPQFE